MYLKESSTEMLGIFYSIKNRIKPFVKELIFIFATPLKRGNREVAQAGSAPGLGPGGRRFESCLPDLKKDRLDFNRGVLN